MRKSHKTLTVLLGVAVGVGSLASCSAKTPQESFLAQEPATVEISKQCEQLLVPIRLYMTSHTSPIDETVRHEVRDLADAAYTACTPAEFRSFADTELMDWARTVGTVPTPPSSR